MSVFGTIRDLEAALRVLDRDPTINANVVQSEQFNCTKTRILPATGNLKPWDIGTLGNSYLVNIKFNELIPLPDENACVKKAGGTPVGGS